LRILRQQRIRESKKEKETKENKRVSHIHVDKCTEQNVGDGTPVDDERV
jgi:hypothetical protein